MGKSLWPAIKRSIKEQLAEKSGFWRSCSGCTELEDGQNVHGHPYSDVFKCDIGLGCSDCGGIGAVWDNVDYSDIGKPETAVAPVDGGSK